MWDWEINKISRHYILSKGVANRQGIFVEVSLLSFTLNFDLKIDETTSCQDGGIGKQGAHLLP